MRNQGMSVTDWLTLLFPTFLKLLDALVMEDPMAERQAMIDLELGIARKKAERKLGPRP